MSSRRLSNILYTRGIRGIIIPGLPRARGHLSLKWEYFACVSLTHTVFKPDLDRVSHFHFEGMSLAIRKLKHYGYRRIGYANLIEQDERSHHGWLAAYLSYQHTHTQKHCIPPFVRQKWNKAEFTTWITTYHYLGAGSTALKNSYKSSAATTSGTAVTANYVVFEGNKRVTFIDILLPDTARNWIPKGHSMLPFYYSHAESRRHSPGHLVSLG